MIEWKLITNSFENIFEYNLLSDTSISIKELDYVEFIVNLDDITYKELGFPTILIGDIPALLYLSHKEKDTIVFKSFSNQKNNEARLFYNFFGKSSLALSFEKSNKIFYSKSIDILAKKENAYFADKMLNFLTKNMEDAIQICFSRSKISSSLDNKNTFEFSKIDIIKQSIEYLQKSFILFKKDHKYYWEQNVDISQNGQPIGPSSVDWALKNLDKLSPSDLTEANIIFNNRGYVYPELPREILVKNTDTYENRVINSYLYRVHEYLLSLYDEFNKLCQDEIIDDNNEYVRFDHTISKYANFTLKIKSKEIIELIQQVSKLKTLYSKIIAAKSLRFSPPKITSYVSKHNHYREVFKQIEKFNKAASPNLDGNNLLLGLKNLSLVYELTCLVLIYKAIESTFSAVLIEQSYYEHDYIHGYGGLKKDRPTGKSNNYFKFTNDIYTFELEYEPKIYKLNKKSKPGDLINVSNNKPHPLYGPHYYSPDFIIKITNNLTNNASIIIMDAKYKNKKNVQNYDLENITNKYLLNIHQLKHENFLGTSPIKLVLALFANDKNGRFISTIDKAHSLIGKYPILPQTVGIHLFPTQTDLLEQQLISLLSVIEAES